MKALIVVIVILVVVALIGFGQYVGVRNTLSQKIRR